MHIACKLVTFFVRVLVSKLNIFRLKYQFFVLSLCIFVRSFKQILKILHMNRAKLEEMQRNIYYSDKYYDDEYEYRHVVLPKEMVQFVPKTHLMTEEEWRGIGVQQSKGWVHYMTHTPEPHILLFKRPITSPPSQNGN